MAISNYTRISSATTTTAKSGPGVLRSIVITGGTMGNITVYDNTAASGTIIAAFTFGESDGHGGYEFGVPFSAGLTIVTAAATNLTVIYD